MRILLDDLSGDAGGTPSGPSTEPTAAVPQSSPASPAVVSSAPAAETVANATVTEETELLRRKLEAEQAARKKVEQEHSSVVDEYQRYKDATEARATPVPVKRAPVKAEAKSYRFLRRR